MAQTGAGYVAVLVNPHAGGGRRQPHRARPVLAAVLDRLAASGRDVRPLAAGSRAEAALACRTVVADGAAALVAVGGDGTMHLGLQAVAATAVPFGVVPAGTGNDFARDTGAPADPVAAATAIADAIRGGRHRRVDLARLTGPDGRTHWFGAVLAAGFDARVNERANAMRWPAGRRRYDLAILLELLRLPPTRYRLTIDGVRHDFAATVLAVGNTASYGGGMRIVPAADPTDGLLDVVAGGPLGRAALIRLKPRLYRGTHVQHPTTRLFRGRQVHIEADGIVGYADGERLSALPVTVTCVPGALCLLAP